MVRRCDELMSGSLHRPVMVQEVMEALQPASGKCLLDGTVGYGGHAVAWLEASAPEGRLIGLDRDPQALKATEERLASYKTRYQLIQANYQNIPEVLESQQIKHVDAVLLDLGVSSAQLDSGERGFSFKKEGPLDMRMNPADSGTAADIVNTWKEEELADLFYHYGEERRSRRFARAIVNERKQTPFKSTAQLATLIARETPRSSRRIHRKIHPATRVFQALRIAVNEELDALDRFLAHISDILTPGGRLAILSYHSLEDRRVKLALRQGQQEDRLNILTKKPSTPTEEEIRENPRARSAKLRVASSKESA